MLCGQELCLFLPQLNESFMILTQELLEIQDFTHILNAQS